MRCGNYATKGKHVGIVSLFGLYNYGNRLQGYALDKILTDLGFESETVVFYRKLGISVILSYLRTCLIEIKGSKQERRRVRRFKDFVASQRIRYVFYPAQIRAIANQYDFFCVGSDQVWNPEADLFSRTKLLEFAEPKQRVALSPSFGVDSLPSCVHKEYEMCLKDFRAISVREESGAQIVENLLGMRPPVLIDPTLALSEKEWRKKASYAMVPKCHYILAYFLGGWSKNLSDYIELPMSNTSVMVVDLLDKSSVYYGCGPQDFIGMIDNASCVITDSFHASVFSTILNTPFRVYRRNESTSTYSRIETFLQTYELDNVEGFGPIPSFDVGRRAKTMLTLKEKRLELVAFLREALDA